jgi:hypothetical protein
MSNSMKSSESISPQESLAREFEQWQKLFYDGVHIYFAKRNVQRGEVALESWETRFTKFLSERLPALANKYQQLRLKNKLYPGNFVHPHYLEGFMSQTGDAITSFLEQCIDDARKGNLDVYRVDATGKISNIQQMQATKKNIWRLLLLFPKTVGYFLLDIFGRNDARESTATTLGWICLIVFILLLAKVITPSMLESAWRFFFPVQ